MDDEHAGLVKVWVVYEEDWWHIPISIHRTPEGAEQAADVARLALGPVASRIGVEDWEVKQ